MTITRKELLEVALSGYQQQVGVIQDRMREITRELMGITPKRHPPKRRRRMSPEGRARIAAATRKRWAAYRKGRGASSV